LRAGTGLIVLPPGTATGEGVVVADIDPSGLAADRGIDPGDVVLSAFDRSVSSQADIDQAFKDAGAAGKAFVLIRVRSGKTIRFIAIPIG
jgi:serine protease Do